MRSLAQMTLVLLAGLAAQARPQQSVADGFGPDLLAPPVALYGPLEVSGPLDSGDVNEDGHIDLLAFNNIPTGALLYLGTGGAGGFAPAIEIPMDAPVPTLGSPLLKLADLNGDGHLDVLLVTQYEGEVLARLGDGTGNFGEQLVSGPQLLNGITADIADLDGDGVLDLVLGEAFFAVPQGRVVIRRGHGDGTFGPAETLFFARLPEDLRARDLDGDGLADLAYTDTMAAHVHVLVTHHNVGGGVFAAGVVQQLPAVANTFALEIADANSDGVPDAWVGSYLPGGVTRLLGVGNGTFAAGVTVPLPDSPYTHLAIADLDRDGMADILAATYTEVRAQRMGRGGPIGAPVSTPPFFNFAGGLLAADLDGDGLPDVALTGNQVEVLGNALSSILDIGYGGTAAVGTPKLEIVFSPELHVIHGGVGGVPQLLSGLLFFGVEAQYTPFSGGVLVPSPDVKWITTTGIGFVLGFPASIPTGTAIYAQVVLLSGPGLKQPLPSNAVVIIAE